MPFKPKRIVLHHSATKDSGTVSWDAIRRYHMKEMKPPMVDIGYHAGVELVGTVYVIQYGRPVTAAGAHTKNFNHNSLGFCFVGDYDKVTPPSCMIDLAVSEVIAPWCRQFGLGAADIFGHRDFAKKTCPGKLFDLNRVRALVSEALKEPK
jgi:N-acetylmuramoyl-L-alanine amidase